MFDFHEELKYYEPGLETLEDTLSGDIDKDLVELMQILLQARPDPLAESAVKEAESEGSAADGEQKESTEA